MDGMTKDGSISVATDQIRQETRYAETVPMTADEIRAWGESNRIKPSGDTGKDVAAVNRMRSLLRLPAFVLKDRPVGGAIPRPDTPHRPAIKEAELTAIVETQSAVAKRDYKAPVDRTVSGLIHAMFDEIDLVRAGKGDAEKIKQLSQLSVRVVDLMNVEAKFRIATGSQGKVIDG